MLVTVNADARSKLHFKSLYSSGPDLRNSHALTAVDFSREVDHEL